MEGKTVKESSVTISHVMLPQDANISGKPLPLTDLTFIIPFLGETCLHLKRTSIMWGEHPWRSASGPRQKM
jgi:hypothetical protein